MAKKSFVVYKDWKPLISALYEQDKALVGDLFMAIMDYQNEGIIPDIKSPIYSHFFLMKQKFDADNEEYKKTCEKNRENIQKRWSEYDRIQKDTTVYDRIPPNTNGYHSIPLDTDNDNDNEKDNDNDKDIKEKDSSTKSRKRNAFTPPTLEEVEDYCRERNSPVDPKQFYEYFSTGNWVDSKGNKVQNWKQKVITWEKYKQGNGDNRASNVTPFDANAYIMSKINGGVT